MEEQLNKEAKEGLRVAADAARTKEEGVGIEDQKHTSGGVFVAVDSNLGTVAGEEGAVTSIPGNEAWENVSGGTESLFQQTSGIRKGGHLETESF